ncbi:MAG TPA: ThuA domain-containing protein [Bacillota bacterium]|nr:ThuA domain-containing protein [Bacillota bacterium]
MNKPKVLILGDYTYFQYHPFSGIAQVLERLLKDYEIELTFTEDRNELEIANLSQYDALITYVDSWGQFLPQTMMESLLNFTVSGKRIFGIHCGISYTNPEYSQLFGARFTGHPPYQEIPVKITGENHPWVKDLSDFRIEDELYLFEFTDSSQINVLLEGEFEEKTYPLAWEKSIGTGALLYLALGHDQRAFENELFQKALLNGALWATKRI